MGEDYEDNRDDFSSTESVCDDDLLNSNLQSQSPVKDDDATDIAEVLNEGDVLQRGLTDATTKGHASSSEHIESSSGDDDVEN